MGTPLSRAELFAPWREPADTLRARTVGRETLLHRIRQGARELVEGRRPLPLYLFGPRGAGKSHHVTLLRHQLRGAGIPVHVVPEDLPAIRSAAELLARAAGRGDRPAWRRWRHEEVAPARLPGRSPVLVIEGLDRRLAELGSGPGGSEERQRLRATWEGARFAWVLGTGVELGPGLTDPEEPLYGFFDPEPVAALVDREAFALLERTVPEDVRRAEGWPGLAETLVAVAGGSPRVLLTLAESSDVTASASEAIRVAVDRFTLPNQLRFRDLAGPAQRIVELLAAAPHELGPSEMARAMGERDTTVATQARRLAQDGVLLRREERRATWYTLADPLLRFWLENPGGRWEQTRVALASGVLQALGNQPETLGLPHAPGSSLGGAPVGPVAAARELARALADGKGPPRELFRDWLRALRVDHPADPVWSEVAPIVLEALDRSPGPPWSLSGAEAGRLGGLPILRAALLLRGRLPVHPPMLSPDDLGPETVLPTSPDLDLLLVAAVSRDAPSLVERVLVQASRRSRYPAMPANPRPTRPCPRRADLLVAWMIAALERADPPGPPLTWARTLAEVSDGDLERVLLALSAPEAAVGAVQVALLALGHANADTLARVVAHWPERGRDEVEATLVLAGQLRLGDGELHPELEALRSAVKA